MEKAANARAIFWTMLRPLSSNASSLQVCGRKEGGGEKRALSKKLTCNRFATVTTSTRWSGPASFPLMRNSSLKMVQPPGSN